MSMNQDESQTGPEIPQPTLPASQQQQQQQYDDQETIGVAGLAAAVTEIDDFSIQEALEEVEILLAEIRRVSVTESGATAAMKLREEYISNLLVTKRVMLKHPLGGEVDQVDNKGESKVQEGMIVIAGAEEDELAGKHPSKEECFYINTMQQCPICLVEYKNGDEVSFSHNKQCKHYFHIECIKNWLLQERDDCPCCRNNYLALSDDEDENDDDENDSESEVQEESSSSESQLSQAEDPWVPSYLATFHRLSEGASNTRSNRGVPNENESVELDVEFGHPDSIPNNNNLHPDDERIYVDMGQFTDDEETLYDSDDQNDPDEWSCPSVEQSAGETSSDAEYALPPRTSLRRRRRALIARLRQQQQQQRQQSEMEQTESLGLGDLIVDSLMRRLDERGEDRSFLTGDDSSSGVYTEGSEANNDDARILTSHDNLHVCAICRCEYQVNQELCWSQDPLCSHVFHRQCMQEWILDHDYCPLCTECRDITNTSNCSTTSDASFLTQKEDSDSDPDLNTDSESVSSELFLETGIRVVSNLELGSE